MLAGIEAVLTLVAMHRAECRFLGTDNEGDDWCVLSSLLLARWDGMMGCSQSVALWVAASFPGADRVGKRVDFGLGGRYGGGTLSLSLSLCCRPLVSFAQLTPRPRGSFFSVISYHELGRRWVRESYKDAVGCGM